MDFIFWLKSYFADRNQTISINGELSEPKALLHGVSQGSRLGPMAFVSYEHPVAEIAKKHDVSIKIYADDKQLYLSFDPESDCQEKEVIEECIGEIGDWLIANMLKLNDSKTEYLVISSPYNQKHITDDMRSITIGSSTEKHYKHGLLLLLLLL